MCLLNAPNRNPFAAAPHPKGFPSPPLPPDHLKSTTEAAECEQQTRFHHSEPAGRAADNSFRLLANSPRHRRVANPAILDQCIQTDCPSTYDATNVASAERAPKIPKPGLAVLFLLRYYPNRPGDALDITLNNFADGARRNPLPQLGGGFQNRYPRVTTWLFPHFERCSNDQGQLAIGNIGPQRITHYRFYADNHAEHSRFSLREMQQPRPRLASARDADAESLRKSPNQVRRRSFTSGPAKEIGASKQAGCRVRRLCLWRSESGGKRSPATDIAAN